MTCCIEAQAPTFKWGISIANLADMQRPAENVSYPQQLAVTATGIIWSRFATQVSRLNWPFRRQG
jgi:mitochondrial pyruvate carrier 2